MQYPTTTAAAAVSGSAFKGGPHKAALSPQSPTVSTQITKRRGPTAHHHAAGVKGEPSSLSSLPHRNAGSTSMITSTSSSSTLSLRTPEQVHADLLYLQQHRVCETLEFIVKTLLRDQPEDPILNICNMLRESNRSDSSVRVSVSNQTRLDALNGATPPGAVRGTSGQRVLDLSRERGVKEVSPSKTALITEVDGGSDDSVRREDGEGEESSAADMGEVGEVPPPGGDKGRAHTNMCLFPEEAVATTPTQIGSPVTDGSGRGGWSHVHGKQEQAQTAADTTIQPALFGGSSHGLPRGGLNGSVNSRITTPASSTAGGARWLADTLQQTVQNGTFPQRTIPRIERDESSRSDGSLFSVASVDMTEFLAEFRGAHQDLYGDVHHRAYISIQDLADIVDRINIPLPDVRLLVDLFNELGEKDPDVPVEQLASEIAPDAVGGDAPGVGLVRWDTFLARMNFRIQGRYPQEILRAAFAALDTAPLSPRSATEEDSRRGSQPCMAGGLRPPLPPQQSIGSNLDGCFAQAAPDTASVLSSSYNAAGGQQQAVQPLSLTALRAPTVSTTAELISTVALWDGLGIQHRMSDLVGALRAMQVKPAAPSSPISGSPPRSREQFPVDPQLAYQLHITDFIRLVHRLQTL